MDYFNDNRIILTLDAGGTNFVFSAIQSCKEIGESYRKPISVMKLNQILATIIDGFEKLHYRTNNQAVAISFSFPGPADYKNGIIGDLANIPEFRGGIALKSMLENHFKLPVFINNDGDLFTLGESIAGLLPEINATLLKNGHSKQFGNLFGITLGTGFGAGIVINQQMFLGDNSAGVEISRIRNKLYPETNSEDSVSIRGIKRVYAREANLDINEIPEPETIYKIGSGQIAGNQNAAIKAFTELAIVAGDSLANAVTLIDGLVVIGGGLSGAHPLFLQTLVDEMNSKLITLSNKKISRTELLVCNLESKDGLKKLVTASSKQIKVPFTKDFEDYDPVKKIGVGISKLGTSKATSIGAYVYALNCLS